MTSLSTEAIHQAMDASCSVAQQKNPELLASSLVLEPVKKKNQEDDRSNDSSTIGQCHSVALKAADNEEGVPIIVYGTVSFYVAYSSWEGPELFITELDLDESHTDKKSSILYTMAEVAVSLKCARLVWQTLDRNEEDRKLYSKLGAETLKGVLTLCLQRSKMIDFMATRTTPQKTLDNKSDSPVQSTVEAIHEAIDSSLIPSNAILAPNKLRLRRATRSDVDTILGLVQGLADFVKESDSVKITIDQYLHDGFGKAPLFHCILVEDVTDHPSAPIGMAFFFFGVAKTYGRFLYLEDLFLHQDSRGRGGGKQLMYTLSDVCLKLDCESFVWQALDWNTPSLQFYDKIGAQVQEGVITMRFAGDKLLEFGKTLQVK